MGKGDDVVVAQQLGLGKVGDVSADLAVLDRFDDVGVVDELASRAIDDDDAGLHRVDAFGVDHVLGLRRRGDVQGDEVALCEEFGDVGDVLDVLVEEQCAVHAEVGVIAEDVHAQLDRRVGDESADRAKSDDAQRLAGDLAADERLLALFDLLVDVVAFERLHPIDALDDLAAAEDEAAQHQFFDGVGVGAGGVEHANALLGHLVDGDVVDSCAGSRDRLDGSGDFIVVHIEAAQNDRVGGGALGGDDIVVGAEHAGDFGADLVEFEDLVHNAPQLECSSSNFFMNSMSFLTPSTGIAL